jgi:hypothetical protein
VWSDNVVASQEGKLTVTDGGMVKELAPVDVTHVPVGKLLWLNIVDALNSRFALPSVCGSHVKDAFVGHVQVL